MRTSDGLQNVGAYVMPVLRQSTHQLMSINLREFVTVVAHEVKLHSHKADGPIRDHLTARAAKRNAFAFRHGNLFREGFWRRKTSLNDSLRQGMHDYRPGYRCGWPGEQGREVLLDPFKRASV